MDSIEFLNFAKKIDLNDPKSEIDCRQIVSRSYYCAFHKVTEKSLSLNIPVNAYAGGTHASLSTTLASLRPANTKLKGIAFRLKAFHMRRVKADYDLNTTITSVFAKEAIADCEKILMLLNDVKNL